eukprot:9361942-Pyramimonas_sp.AAC.1
MDRPVRRRPNRTAAERRAQYARAQGRAAQHLLQALGAVSAHRGQQLSRLGRAVRLALLDGSP